jgi:hypothetical protein
VGSRVGFSFGFFTIAYLSRLFVSIAFLVSTGYLNALSSNLAGYRNPQIKVRRGAKRRLLIKSINKKGPSKVALARLSSYN